MSQFFEKIEGFVSPEEYNRFLKYVEKQCESNVLEEITPDTTYGRGEIYGGRWFKELASGCIWRLVEPDPPFYGVWEVVDKK